MSPGRRMCWRLHAPIRWASTPVLVSACRVRAGSARHWMSMSRHSVPAFGGHIPMPRLGREGRADGQVVDKALVITHGVHEPWRREILGIDIGEFDTEVCWIESPAGPLPMVGRRSDMPSTPGPTSWTYTRLPPQRATSGRRVCWSALQQGDRTAHQCRRHLSRIQARWHVLHRARRISD